MVTQEDIAKKLKISRATVSRALSGKSVKEETKQAILEEVRNSGYTPSNVATILAQKNTRVVYAFIIATVDEGYGEQTYAGIRDAANIWSGYNIEVRVVFTDIMQPGDQAKRQLAQFDDILDHQKVDGVIFSALSQRNMEHVSRRCRKQTIPLMTLDMIYTDNNLCHVGPNYFNLGTYSAACLANLMMKQGELLILNFDEGYELSQERMRGFLHKLGEYPQISHRLAQLESMSRKSYEQLLEAELSRGIPRAIYAPYHMDHIAAYLTEKGLAGEIILISNGINQAVEEYLYNGTIRAIVSARPYFLGAVVTNNFFKHFFRPNDSLTGNIDVTCDIYIKENYVRYEKIF